jgi:hypothetical protein
MRERIVLICPTAQGRTPAARWHDGQNRSLFPPVIASASEAIQNPSVTKIWIASELTLLAMTGGKSLDRGRRVLI